MVSLQPDGPCRWRIDPTGDMRVPGVVFATERLLPAAVGDQALDQGGPVHPPVDADHGKARQAGAFHDSKGVAVLTTM